MKNSRLRAAALLLFAGIGGSTWAQVPGPNNAITDVPGITVGHSTGSDSGATVVLGATATGGGVAGGVSTPGGSPGTRETDLMRPDNMVETMNAIVLSGGSLYGIAAASGVMRCLEAAGIGFSVGGGNVVPIAPTIVTSDRATCGGPPASRPDFASGLAACAAAAGGPVAQGNVGAGTGAVAGGVKGGIGTASVVLPNGIIVGALVDVNSEGTPYDANGDLYGASLGLGSEFGGLTRMGGKPSRYPPSLPGGALRSGTNVVVATNVALTKSQATHIAEMANDGVARGVNPAHTSGDSDSTFVLGTARLAMSTLGDANSVVTQIGAAAQDVVARAIVHAVLEAKTTSCQASYCDTFPSACRRR